MTSVGSYIPSPLKNPFNQTPRQAKRVRNGESGAVVCDGTKAIFSIIKHELHLGKEIPSSDSQIQMTNLFTKHEADSPLEEYGENDTIARAKRLKLTCSNTLCQDSASCSRVKIETGSEDNRKSRREAFDLNVDCAEALQSDKLTKEENDAYQFNQPQAATVSSRPMVGSTLPAFFPSCPSQKPSLFHASAKLNSSAALCETNNALPPPPAMDSQRLHVHRWRERFAHLQFFLKQRDEVNCDEHVKMLRSLTDVGRSKHALELERRAIDLLLEEGKELHRMKCLGILKDSLPKSLVAPISQPHSIHFQNMYF